MINVRAQFISKRGFESGNGSNIAQQMKTVRIIDGNLFVQLTPTTDAVPAAQYLVKYSSDGKIQFEENWAVPASTTTLRVRDVRTSQPIFPNTGGGAGGVTAIQESDVTGLVQDLVAAQSRVRVTPTRARRSSTTPAGWMELRETHRIAYAWTALPDLAAAAAEASASSMRKSRRARSMDPTWPFRSRALRRLSRVCTCSATDCSRRWASTTHSAGRQSPSSRPPRRNPETRCWHPTAVNS